MAYRLVLGAVLLPHLNSGLSPQLEKAYLQASTMMVFVHKNHRHCLEGQNLGLISLYDAGEYLVQRLQLSIQYKI